MRFEDASASASYEPYHYSPPLQIGGLYERGGLRMHRFSLSGEQPFWADLVANIFDDHPFAQIYEVTILDQRFCDADMPLLDEFAGLRVLCLSLTRVTDDGVWLLTKNNKLTKLELSRTQISDRSLLMLDKLPELRELDIGGTNITKSALEEFRKRHPDCLVFD